MAPIDSCFNGGFQGKGLDTVRMDYRDFGLTVAILHDRGIRPWEICTRAGRAFSVRYC